MGDIGALPTKTNVRITSSTGDHGTIEPASPMQAGVMTAEQAKRLDEMWKAFALGEAPTAQATGLDLVTRSEVHAMLQRVQRPADLAPIVAELRQRIDALMLAAPTQLSLPAPGESPMEIVDARARGILGECLENMEALALRVAALERRMGIVVEVAEQAAIAAEARN